jgi:hypothetical protein
MLALSWVCSWVSAFLPVLTLGLVMSSISSSTFCALARRQLGDHQLPLAARQLLDLPARAHLEAAAAAAVGLGNVGCC